MGNQEILFASLVGSKIVKMVPRLDQVQNEILKYVIPPVPGLPFRNTDGVESTLSSSLDYGFPETWQADKPLTEAKQFFPLSLSVDQGKSWFLLPYEPMINISGKNNVIMRNVAKWNQENDGKLSGTIKERWSQDDYQITITGALMGSILRGSVEDCFPKADFQKLKEVLTYSKEVWVKCPPLELLDIHKIVILDFTFPFTKGENVQAYDIKAVSDFSYNLLLRTDE